MLQRELMDESVPEQKEGAFFENPRIWQTMILLAIALNAIAILTSELGLDAHVEGGYVESENGWVLDWGDTRTDDPLASNPNDAKEVPESSVNPGQLMPFAVIGMILAILVGIKLGCDRTTIAVLMLNPALVFSIGRGYSEYTYLAIVAVAWTIWRMSRNYNNERNQLARVTAISISAMMMLWVLVIKLKIDSMNMLFPLLFLTTIGIGIDRLPNQWLQPQKAMKGGFAIGLLSVVALGIFGYGSFTVVTTDTIRFIQALPISVFGVIIVYGMVGMVLWPFVPTTWEKMRSSEDRLTGELSLFIGVMAGAIVTYVACLWTFESILWDSEWPWHMWTMGNNGRYITILAIPSYLLIKQVNGTIDWTQTKAGIGVLIILPISMAAGIHGQTYWTDDAAKVMSNNMEQEENFLFIHDATLGMHYLYTFHTYIDDASERNITGHWRAPDSGWEIEMTSENTMPNRGDLSSIEWVVLSPGIKWEEPPGGWHLAEEGEADFMNGGGKWQLWTTHSENSILET